MLSRFAAPFSLLTARIGLLALVLVGACQPVRFLAEYDPATDARLTELQRSVEALLTEMERTLGTPGGTVERYQPYYDDLRIELRTLAVRAAAREKNQLQVEQLDRVLDQIDLLEQAHREGIAREEIPVYREIFAQSFRAMLALELAKRRGDTP